MVFPVPSALRPTSTHFCLVLACALAISALGCSSGKSGSQAEKGTLAAAAPVHADDAKRKQADRAGKLGKKGDNRVSQTQHPAGPMQPRPPLPKARPTPTGTFFGLGAINPDKDTRKHHFYPGPKPPPRVGKVIELPVPPPGPPPKRTPAKQAAPKPLSVSRVAPNGTVGVTNAVSAQFNQPMVPVGSLQDLKKWPVPLTISPKITAKARWLGTRTVALESTKRLPFSTLFTATVPAGVTSATGGKLSEPKTWTFETPRLRITWRYPTGGQVRPETLIAVSFNQDIDSEKVAAALRLRHGSDTIKLAPVSPKAWKTLPKMMGRLAGANAKRTVVLRPTRLLPVDTSYVVALADDSYSKEGPLRTKKPLTWSFSTYPKLKIDRYYCQWRDKTSDCREGNPVTIRTTTSITADQDLRELVKVIPEPSDLAIRPSGRGLSITGGFEASSSYTVKISGKLRDIFGQQLGTNWQQKFSYRDGEPVLQLPATRPVVLERRAGPQISARVRNLSELKLHLMPIGKDGLHQAFRSFGGTWRPHTKHPFERLKGGKRIVRTIRPKTPKNRLGIVKLALKPGLAGRKTGVVAVSVEADWPYNRGWFSSKTAYASLLVQTTDIGITARWDKSRVVAYVAHLDSGKPMAGAKVELIDGKGTTLGTATTDARGTAEMPCTSWSYRQSRFLWVTENGSGQTGFMALKRRVRGPNDTPQLRHFVWTDRNPYKPGEKVQLSGMLRVEDRRKTGGVVSVKGIKSVSWKLRSARGIEVAKGETEVSDSGAFHVELALPADMDLGNASFQGKAEGWTFGRGQIRHYFQVQNYRTPEFKVSATIRPAEGGGILRFGQEAELEVRGNYYFGAAMSGAKAHYTLRRSAARYRPPNHGGWAFGRVHSWRSHRHTGSNVVAKGDGHLDADGRWRIAHLLNPTRKVKGPKGDKDSRFTGPVSYKLEVSVTDDARQRISARTSQVVHQGAVYAGLKLNKKVIRAGKKVRLSVVAADTAGKRLAKAVQVRLVRLEAKKQGRWSHAPRFRRGRSWRPWRFDEVEVGRCTATTTLTAGADGRPTPATCDLALPTAGHYRFIAQVKDDKGTANTSHIEAYAFGKKRVRWAVRDMGKVELVPDKSSYEPGETATLLIKSPFPAARGLLSVERNGLLSWRIVDVPTGASAVRVDLDPTWAPNVNVSVTLFAGRSSHKKVGRTLDPDGKPRTATGNISLRIALTQKRIVVAVSPKPKVLTPGQDLEVAITTRDANGKPVPSGVTVWAVDEGVLALLGFGTPNPLSYFHHHRSAHAAGDDLRAAILVERFARVRGRAKRKRYSKKSRRRGGDGSSPTRISLSSSSVGGGLKGARRRPAAAPRAAAAEEREAAPADAAAEAPGGSVGQGPAPTLRQLFASTAFFRAGTRTNSEGIASLKFKLPDNTTTFRLMVVADADADRFGSGDSQFTTRQPVLLRAALPRFANLHDDFDAAVVLHNETGADQTFVVGGRGAGVSWHDGFEKTVKLASGDAKEVRFRVRATQTGRATFQFAARVKGSQRKDFADAVQKSIPVNLPATLEAFATYGNTKSSVKQPIQAPADAIAGFGGLDITLSSTALSGLEDAVRYLVQYPYECAEQTASRLIPIAMLGKLLDAFQIGKVKERAARDTLVKNAVQRLVGLQHWDGGFKFWPKSRRSSRWVTPWATFALLLAKEQGAEVPTRTLTRANRYLHKIVRRARWNTHWWRVSDTLSLWVLTHKANTAAGKQSAKTYKRTLDRLYGERDKLPVFAKGWLMTVAHRMGDTSKRDELLRGLDNNVVEKAGTAHIAEGKSEDLRILMHSSDRTDAIVLGALVEVQPKHPLVGKLIRGLMSGRIKGRWSTTQANAWALVTARRYFDVFERQEPKFTTQMWLGDGFLGSQKFHGRSLAKAHAHVPMDGVQSLGAKHGHKAKSGGGKVVDLVLAKKGPGRMYYRLGMRYAPKSLKLPAEEQGFTVQRSYEALNPAEQDRVKLLPNGSWRVRAGTDVRVRLTVVVPTRGHYVVVDDPLPAGFEGQNPAFRTTSSSAAHTRNRRAGQRWRWYRWWRWNHIEMRDDRVLLFADRLWSGVYSHSYVARATSVGRFVVPPARAEEMYAPETFGRNGTTFVEVVP
ncbi:MAG: hypothetical protein KC502_09145 [Myxococcales bacterium]|nr:hypothetical protein [Myxococcales bacterium]